MQSKILYITTYDPLDQSRYSGAGYFLFRSLREQVEPTEGIGPLRRRGLIQARVRQAYWRFLRSRRHLMDRDPSLVRGFSAQVDQEVERRKPDVIVSPGAIPLAYCRNSVPKVIWADATFRLMRDYYETFSNLSPATIQNGEAIEKLALEKVSLAVFSSSWAAKSAHEDYGLPEDRIGILPYGANMENLPKKELVLQRARKRSKEKLSLLFLGKDWKRKGGEKAFQVAKGLSENGISVELIVIGCTPPKDWGNFSFLRNVGRLDKKDPEDLERLKDFFFDSHFLILPTVSDATPIVFSEAAAFGLPSLSTRTGGVPDIVQDGENGYLFSQEEFVPKAIEKNWGALGEGRCL